MKSGASRSQSRRASRSEGSCSPCDLWYTERALQADEDEPPHSSECDEHCKGKWETALVKFARALLEEARTRMQARERGFTLELHLQLAGPDNVSFTFRCRWGGDKEDMQVGLPHSVPLPHFFSTEERPRSRIIGRGAPLNWDVLEQHMTTKDARLWGDLSVYPLRQRDFHDFHLFPSHFRFPRYGLSLSRGSHATAGSAKFPAMTDSDEEAGHYTVMYNQPQRHVRLYSKRSRAQSLSSSSEDLQ